MNALARSLRLGAGPFAFCGIAVRDHAGDRFGLSAMDGLDVTPDTFWRAASISKILTGRVAWLACDHAGVAPDTPVEDLLGFPFRSPAGGCPTVAQVASHCAGLTDEGGYIVPPDMCLSDWLDQAGGAIWSGAAPGQQFEYSNLGFVVLAAVIERMMRVSFATAVQQLLTGPKDIAAYFNWQHGGAVASYIPTFRRGTAGFEAQIDSGPIAPPAPARGAEFGQQAHRFSPQGGARMSLRSALSIASTLSDHPVSDGWVSDPARTRGPADLFQSYAWGAQIFDDPAFYPRPLIGHFANAYGMCGGVWKDRERGTQFAYVLNGLSEGDDSDAMRAPELEIFEAVSQTA